MNAAARIAILVSSPSHRQPTRQQAELARQLSDAKIAARQDIVSVRRLADAKRLMLPGMKILFHQGGATSIWDGVIPGVGRLVAAGRLGGIVEGFGAQDGLSPDSLLLGLTQTIFPNWPMGGWLWFTDLRLLPEPPITKSVIDRPPRRGDNYIVIGPANPGYYTLQSI